MFGLSYWMHGVSLTSLGKTKRIAVEEKWERIVLWAAEHVNVMQSCSKAPRGDAEQGTISEDLKEDWDVLHRMQCSSRNFVIPSPQQTPPCPSALVLCQQGDSVILSLHWLIRLTTFCLLITQTLDCLQFFLLFISPSELIWGFYWVCSSASSVGYLGGVEGVGCLDLYEVRDYPGGPVVRTCFHCRGYGFYPWSRNWDHICHMGWPTLISGFWSSPWLLWGIGCLPCS